MKVIGGGYLVPSAAEVDVPSWDDFNGARKEFEAAIGQLWEKIKDINDNKQALWNAVNEFKRDPKADIYSEFRALRDAAFSAKEQLNGPIPNDGWHVWKCIEVASEERKAIARRLDSIQADAAKAFRTAIEETLHPIFQYGLEQSIREVVAVKEENKTLKEEIAALRAEIDELKSKR